MNRMNLQNETNAKAAIIDWIQKTSFQQFAEAVEKRIIGQPELRRLLLVIYNYLECIAYDKPINHNILLAGPSGCGKTELFRTLRAYFDDCFKISVSCVDLSSVTTAGFKGAEPASILSQYVNSGKNYGFGIVFLDEFDKRLIPQTTNNNGNVSAEVQANLLKIVEGCSVTVDKMHVVDTERLCFIGMGSFDYFRKKKLEHERANSLIGFHTKEEKKEKEDTGAYAAVAKADMTEGGALVELLGRFPYLFNFMPLEDDKLLPLIEKVRANVEKTLVRTKLLLMPEMIELLKGNCRTEYGVRRVDELLREKAMQAYLEAALTQTEGTKSKLLVITLESEDGYKMEYRDLLLEEEQYFMKTQEYVDSFFELDEKIKDGIKEFWREEMNYD